MIFRLLFPLVLFHTYRSSAVLIEDTQLIVTPDLAKVECLCPEFILKNSRCDMLCNTEECEFDGGYCLEQTDKNTTSRAEIKADCLCPTFILTNDNCDSLCDTEVCGYDGGDCKHETDIDADTIQITQVQNNFNQNEISDENTQSITGLDDKSTTKPSEPTGETSEATDETSEPTGETSEPTGETSEPTGETSEPTGETSESTGDTSEATDELPSTSEVPDSSYIIDQGLSTSLQPESVISDVPSLITSLSTLPCECSEDLLNNLICDEECNTIFCEWDKGFCEAFPGCLCNKSLLGNGVCNQECNTPVCIWDMNDCLYIHPGCLCDRLLIGDGICDLSCNTSLCGWDGGDCSN